MNSVTGTLFKVKCYRDTLQSEVLQGHSTKRSVTGTLYKVKCYRDTLQSEVLQGHSTK